MSDRVSFTCNGTPVEVDVAPTDTLLTLLRERLGLVSVKDGCAPQGQCGCCTVLVDGEPRLACVTPVARVKGRTVATLEGLEELARDSLVNALHASGGSQCGFCSPGIVVRLAALLAAGRTDRAAVDRALDAHVCRCTGWQSIYEAFDAAASGQSVETGRDLVAAAERARLEGDARQTVSPDVPCGRAGFADDTAPRDALVAVPVAPGIGARDRVEAAGLVLATGASRVEAWAAAGKVRARRSTGETRPPLTVRPCPPGGVSLATSWVEPAFLEPDASWCSPVGEPADPLANGGAFGAKLASAAPAAARELASHYVRPVRVVYSREDAVRLGPKRPPVSATAVLDGTRLSVEGIWVAPTGAEPLRPPETPYRVAVAASWQPVTVPGPPVSSTLRAFGLAEHTVLVEGALTEAGADREELASDDRVRSVLLDTSARATGGALAGARVDVDPASGVVTAVRVRVAAGDPLDETVLRSYCVGAVHMALGWVLTESLAVDAGTGEVLDLTLRALGLVRARDMPPVEVEVIDEAGPPLASASDAVFAATAAALWNAVGAAEGRRPETFPARSTRAARRLCR